MTSVARQPAGPQRTTRRRGLLAVALLSAVMWLQEVVDALVRSPLDRFGIVPRDPDALTGIALAPFLHGGFGHLIANTVPFLVLGALIALGGLARVLAVTGLVALVSGVGVWLTAPSLTVHLGASGVVFGYATYLLTRGLFDRRLLSVFIGVAVALVYGGVLLGGLVPQRGISWQGHLFGAVGGVIAARLLARRRGSQPVVP